MKSYLLRMTATLFAGIGVLLAAWIGSAAVAADSSVVGANLPVEGRAPSLARTDTWLNSPALKDADLRGKVVLVDFWTYTCINWRRTLPYLRAWHRKYAAHGLVVVGVHTPEFGFERKVDNVRRAVKEQAVEYPVALDGDYAIWKAFANNYWPAVYMVDARGQIRHHQFGEGDYDRLERVIQQLLIEAGHDGFDPALVSAEGVGADAAADWENLRTPETYIGSAQADGLVSLVGDWSTKRESAVLRKAGGKLAYRFHARDVHLVMGPAMSGGVVRFRVTIDGQAPGVSQGVDVDAAGNGNLDHPRMYHLIRQTGPITDRQFEIEFLDAGAEAFVLTFG